MDFHLKQRRELLLSTLLSQHRLQLFDVMPYSGKCITSISIVVAAQSGLNARLLNLF